MTGKKAGTVHPSRQQPAGVAGQRALFACMIGVALLGMAAGCATRPSNPYFPPPESPASVVQPATEVATVPEIPLAVVGQDIFDTNLPPATNVEVHPALPPALAPAPPPPPPSVAARWGGGWVPLERVAAECGVGKLQKTIVGNASRYSMPTRNGTLLITTDSKIVRLNGLNFWLGFPVRVVRGQPCVHALDAEKTLQPLSEMSVINPGTKTIVIDPGHGGTDGGTRGMRGEKEKDYTLDWALRVERLLTNAGWHVVMTRRTDIDVPLPERVAIADRAHADLFVSLHFNSAAPHAGPSGIETYCLTPAGLPSTLLRGYADDARQSFPNNAFDRGNLQLAAKIHRELVSATHALDDGVKRARFMGVLRNQNRPAVLVEGGYLSNPAEFGQISSARHRQKLAEAVAHALQ